MIYTDLTDDGTGTGKVICRRYADTFFLSSAECIFIAREQLKHPNTCKHAEHGTYGSKFVSVVISGIFKLIGKEIKKEQFIYLLIKYPIHVLQWFEMKSLMQQISRI